jgi:hypothetical protein
MDPNAVLASIRELVADYYKWSDADEGYLCRETAIELCGKIEGLDSWLSKGGFLPTDWQNDNLDQK